AAEGDADETDALHGGDAAQQEDLQNNDHDDEELPDIVHDDADDEDSGEGYVTQNSQPAPNFHEAPETATEDDEEVLESIRNKKKHKASASASARKNADGAGPSGTVHDSPTTINEEGERIPIGTNDHGDLGSDSSFENSEDEFEVGMRFEHVAQFKEAIAKYQIQKGLKERIMKEVKETHMKEFAQLRGYAEELLRLSPQSNVQIDSEPPTTPEGKPMFKGIYVCLEGCRKGFLLGCRPVIGVDACFLKGMFKGTILAAVARDGNNQMFPIAWAVVDSESTSSWMFFFRCLADDLSNHTGRDLTFISDQHPGLINARQTVFPEARHRLSIQQKHGGDQKFIRGRS
ncbi:hypothetical protein SLEP1_g37288, partial [Rubroshorea leprosula]